MSEQSLLSSFSILMKASGLAERATSDEYDEEVLICRGPAEEHGHRLINAFVSIQDADIRHAIIDVVIAIANFSDSNRNQVPDA
jgi:hypothetical protein